MIVGATQPDQAGGASASWETDTRLGLALGVTIVGKSARPSLATR
jgi:hypothetical protein